MPATQRRADARAHVAAIPRDWVDEIILVDDCLHRRDRRARPPAAAARGLAPAQRRLRRQPEDLLPRGAAARRRRRRDAASRRPVRAGADPEHGRADPRRARPTWCSARGWLVPGAALAGGMPRWKYVANRFLTAIENRIMGTQPLRGCTPATAPTRARLLLTVPVPAQLARLRLRLRAADAGRPLRLPHRRGAGALPLLRGGLVGRAFGPRLVYGLKTLWAGGRLMLHRGAHPALEQVHRRGRVGRERAAITGERVVTSSGGFNPTWQRHVAAYALCARFLATGRVARPRLRRRAQLPPARAARDASASTSTPRRSPGRSARRSRRRHARAALRRDGDSTA